MSYTKEWIMRVLIAGAVLGVLLVVTISADARQRGDQERMWQQTEVTDTETTTSSQREGRRSRWNDNTGGDNTGGGDTGGDGSSSSQGTIYDYGPNQLILYEASNPAGAVVVIHGRGLGCCDGWFASLAQSFADNGLTAASIDYSEETWREDADAAITWLRGRVPSGTPIGLWGSSFGGIIALAKGLDASNDIAGTVSVSGPIFPDHFDLISSGSSPTYLLYARRDSIAPIADARELYAALRDAEVEAKLVEYYCCHATKDTALTAQAITWLKNILTQ